jgi:hypothetical protein
MTKLSGWLIEMTSGQSSEVEKPMTTLWPLVDLFFNILILMKSVNLVVDGK